MSAAPTLADPDLPVSLTKDVEVALAKYIGVPAKYISGNLTTLFNAMNEAEKKDAAQSGSMRKQISLAISGCPAKDALTKRRRLYEFAEEFFVSETEKRNKETTDACPEMSITFKEQLWKEYYADKTTIKYPPVADMDMKVCKQGLLGKMKLFDLLQGERHVACRFQLPDLSTLKVEHPGAPAIIIPSGGRNDEWIGLAKKADFWWVALAKQVNVIFAVSSHEQSAYSKFEKELGVTMVYYSGFGIGFGRAVGMHIAETLNTICYMTDDRTKKFTFNKSAVDFTRPSIPPPAWITGVLPKGELNVFTIINPASSDKQRPFFPKYFIASKEDKALARYCDVLRLRFNTNAGDTEESSLVSYTTDAISYDNAPGKNTGDKLTAINKIINSKLYASTDNVVLNWSRLNKTDKFLNEWDAIKMQEAAMYQLLEGIVDEIKATKQSGDQAFWKEFDKYITPWFS